MIAAEEEHEIDVEQRSGYAKQMDMVQDQYLNHQKDQEGHYPVNQIGRHFPLFTLIES